MVEQLSGLAGLMLQILFCHYFSLSKVTDFHEKICKKKKIAFFTIIKNMNYQVT